MKIGISSYTYTWAVGFPGSEPLNPLGPLQILEKALKMSVDVVQFADNMPLDKLLDEELDALEKKARQQKLSIELGTKGISSQNLEKHIHLANRLGSSILRTVVDTGERKPSEDEVVDTVCGLINMLKNADVRLAIENHDRLPAKTLARIVKRIDSDYVGICLDTANSFGVFESIEGVIEQLAPWVINLHIKDFSIRRLPHKMGFVIEGKPAGQGRLNIPWLLGKLHAFNRDPNAILELWTLPESKLEETIRKEERWAQSSIKYLHHLISSRGKVGLAT